MAGAKKGKGTRSSRRAGGDDLISETPIGGVIGPAVATKLRVFISWSGERSRALAQALRKWLPLVLHYVEPWLSEADIEAGDRWADAVASELEASNFGIICVTRQSAVAPWLLFEAGALAKSLQGSVVPVLLDLDFRDITGPLTQFQAKKVDRPGLLEIVHSINGAADVPVPEARLQALFEALWPEFEKQVAAIPQEQTPSRPTRPQAEVLEELVGAVRALDSRLREEAHAPAKSRRNRQFLFVEARDLAESMSRRRRDATPLLVLASLYREDAPWMYDLALEVYNSAKQGRMKGAHMALKAFRIASERTSRSRNALIDGPFEDVEVYLQMERHLEQLLPRHKGPPSAASPSASKDTQKAIDVGFDELQTSRPASDS